MKIISNNESFVYAMDQFLQMDDVLSPRETINTNLCWDTRLLEENGIDNINTIDLDLLVDNDEERSVTEPLFHEMIPISLAENPGSFSS